MTAYYNDNDRHVAAWLRELIKAGLITEGDVDERSIRDVKGSDLNGYNRVHFFAGIGGWDYALQLAGWPSDRYVWTGSCPCQPFSGAGQRKGERDERHLWPEFYRLIAECRPSTVFGEQVASNDGREWLAGVRADLEALGYAVGAADLCAAGEGAPHIRQRLFWVADRQGIYGRLSVFQRQSRQKDDESVRVGETERVADGINGRRQDGREENDGRDLRCDSDRQANPSFSAASKELRTDGGLAQSVSGQEHASAARGLHAEPCECSGSSGVGNSKCGGLPGESRRRTGQELENGCGSSGLGDTISAGREGDRPELPRWSDKQLSAQPGSGYWANSVLIPCGDGKARRIEPGLSPLVTGLPAKLVYECSVCKQRTVDDGYFYSGSTWTLPCSILVPSETMRRVWCDGIPITPSSCQWQSTGQPNRKHYDSLRSMSCQEASATTSDVNVCCLRETVPCQVEAQNREIMFCRVCKDIRPHLRVEKMAQSRVTMLKGYGNSIVPEVAAKFIKAFFEANP